MAPSLAQRFAALPATARRQWIAGQPAEILEEMARGEWWWVSRPEQVPPPGDWFVHLALAGRGFGKSRSGSEWIVERGITHPCDLTGAPTEWLVIGETLSDVRVICIEGPAGILRVLERKGWVPEKGAPPGHDRVYRYTKMPKPKIEFTVPGYTQRPRIYFEGADNPDVGRGYNAAGGWLDEIAKWKNPMASWMEGIMPSMRADLKNDHPRVFVTTTPKPIDLLREWLGRSDGSVSVVRGSTFDNSANLSALVLEELRKRYDGTTIGRQELGGEMLDDLEGVLFRWGDIHNNRDIALPELEMQRVMGVDPALTGEDAEMGCVVACRDTRDHMFILADESAKLTGREAALHIWRNFAAWNCDLVVYESELGKAWMAQVLKDAYYELAKDGLFDPKSNPPMKPVNAKQGKKARAEPVAMRYEQGRVHHLGKFDLLETQMVTWDPETTRESPDRLDALVWACRELMNSERKRIRVVTPTNRKASLTQMSM